MYVLKALKKPWLLLPPKLAHDLSNWGLPLFTLIHRESIPTWKPLTWKGMHFRNPLGIAGGVDKNAEHLNSWWHLGCGFIEVGTVTPLPQDPNPGKIVDRDKKLEAMWNKMGFPSAGADEVFYNLRFHSGEYKTPIFVNIGKNRQTANESASEDYLFLIEKFKNHADAFVVNISSPNTQGLRNLQGREQLTQLLLPLLKKSQEIQKPLLVKLSPDMPEEQFIESVQTCQLLGVNGLVLTNTTLSRPSGCRFPPEGGMSGKPLKDLSIKALQLAVKSLGEKRKDMLIISVGGIMTPEDVFERLQMGADLVQIYSALIFHGPQFFHDVARRYDGGQ